MSDHGNNLNKAFIEQQRQRLEALRAQLLGIEQRTLAKERSLQEERGDEAEEFEERAQDMSQLEINQALHDVDKRRLAAVERALQKIAQGSYGLSDISGKPIAQARLEATPEAVLTVQEEQRQENE